MGEGQHSDQLGAMESWRMFQLKVDTNTGLEVGFNAPDGKFYRLGEGESLVLVREGNTRRPMIKRGGENEVPFEDWKQLKEKGANLVAPELQAKLDRAVVKDIVTKTTKKNDRDGGDVLFGKDFSLDDSHREQLQTVIEIGESILHKEKEKPEWHEFLRLLQEFSDKGFSLSFGFPPHWLVDGGATATVQKIKTQKGLPGIQVPSRVFKVYEWDHIIGAIRKTAGQSASLTAGTSAKFLGENLTKLGELFKNNGVI